VKGTGLEQYPSPSIGITPHVSHTTVEVFGNRASSPELPKRISDTLCGQKIFLFQPRGMLMTTFQDRRR
jgi:hypothetical protein